MQGLAPSNFVAAQKLDQSRDAVREAQARIMAQQAVVATAEARLSEARYDQELSVIRAPANGRIVRRYANPGAGASTLNVSNMFDLEPRAGRIVRRCRPSPIPPRPIQARCCAAPPSSAPASCSPMTPPNAQTTASSRWWSIPPARRS